MICVSRIKAGVLTSETMHPCWVHTAHELPELVCKLLWMCTPFCKESLRLSSDSQKDPLTPKYLASLSAVFSKDNLMFSLSVLRRWGHGKNLDRGVRQSSHGCEVLWCRGYMLASMTRGPEFEVQSCLCVALWPLVSHQMSPRKNNRLTSLYTGSLTYLMFTCTLQSYFFLCWGL